MDKINKTQANERNHSKVSEPKFKPTSVLQSKPQDDIPESSRFPSFIMIELTEEKLLTKLSLFKIERILQENIRPKMVQKIKPLLIEITKKTSRRNLKMEALNNIKIKTYPHKTLNSSKGVVKSPELSLCILEEIKANHKNQNVTDVQRIQIRKKNRRGYNHKYIHSNLQYQQNPKQYQNRISKNKHETIYSEPT